MTAHRPSREANAVTPLWSWVIAGTGATPVVGVAARTCGYLLREHVRARAMALMARELSPRGGLAEVSDQDGTAWSIRLDAQEPQ
ncbi:hypothetical protein [Streptomyces mirabilis]|uniref:hypothetical protein n=1 Tax=Streptomyces mirabilis TaxID=68239 RepID=UPI003657E592